MKQTPLKENQTESKNPQGTRDNPISHTRKKRLGLAPWWQTRAVWLLVGVFALGWVFACQSGLDRGESQVSLSQSRQMIIGGAADIRHPAVGALTRNRGKFCTGTLITSQLVITAAHCISSGSIQFRIDTPTGSGNQFTSAYHDVQQAITHPQYSGGGSIKNDLAVLILKQPVTGVTPIPASSTTMDSSWVGRLIKYWGYGIISASPQRSTDVKYHVEITLRTVQSDRFETRDTGKSICFGDSGGPALYEINGQLQVVGVNSYVPNQQCNGGSFCFRVDAYYNSFLQQYLQKYGGKCQSDADCSKCQTCEVSSGRCLPRNISAIPKLCKACKTDADCGGGQCVQRPEGNRCTQACDSNGCCPGGYGCQNNQCAPESGNCPDVPCSSDNDCGPGESCQSGLCRRPGKDLYEDCSASAPCQPGLICVLSNIGRRICFRDCSSDTSCQPEGGKCYTSNDNAELCLCNTDNPCNAGYTCKLTTQNGLCIKDGSNPPQCTQDSDCPSGQVCRNGKCETSQPPPQCTRDSDCPSGQVCRNGKCETNQPPPQCTKDSDCPSGQVCRSGKCEQGQSSQCTRDSDCPSGQGCVNGQCIAQRQCNQNSDCSAGQQCVAGKCVETGPQCRSDAECAVGQTCLNGTCIAQPPPECTQDIHCPSGYICEQLRCKLLPKQCEKDADCAAGNICIDFNCVPVGIVPGTDGGIQPDGPPLNPGGVADAGNTGSGWNNPFGTPPSTGSSTPTTRVKSCGCASNTSDWPELPTFLVFLFLAFLLFQRPSSSSFPR